MNLLNSLLLANTLQRFIPKFTTVISMQQLWILTPLHEDLIKQFANDPANTFRILILQTLCPCLFAVVVHRSKYVNIVRVIAF